MLSVPRAWTSLTDISEIGVDFIANSSPLDIALYKDTEEKLPLPSYFKNKNSLSSFDIRKGDTLHYYFSFCPVLYLLDSGFSFFLGVETKKGLIFFSGVSSSILFYFFKVEYLSLELSFLTGD